MATRPLGISIALAFIGLPFVVRTAQPVPQDFGRGVEEASATPGAGRGQTVFRLVPGLRAGAADWGRARLRPRCTESTTVTSRARVGRSIEQIAGYWIDGGVHSPLRVIEKRMG